MDTSTNLSDNLNIKSYDTLYIRPKPNGYLFIFIILVFLGILIIGIVIWQRNRLYTPTNFGIWKSKNIQPCQNQSGRCTDPATQIVEQTCILDPLTGRGCLDENNNQVTGKRIINVPCQPRCRKYIWREEFSPCLVEGTNIDQCADAGSLGQQILTKTCVMNDSSGSNECTQIIMNPYINSLGATGLQPQIITYDPGTILENSLNCTQLDNPICGTWDRVSRGLKPGTYPKDNILISPGCIFNPTLFPDSQCIVNDSTSSLNENEDIFDLLKEGYVGRQMGCLINQEIIIPAETDPTLEICSISNCNSEQITPDQVRDGKLPSPLFPFSCPNVNSKSNQPTCLHLCRKYPGPEHLGNGEFDPLLNNLLLFRVIGQNNKSLGFIAPRHLPNQEVNGPLFKSRHNDPFIAATDVRLILIPQDLQKPNCPPPLIEFINSALFMVAPRNYTPNNLKSQIMLVLAASFKGWLNYTLENNKKFLIWRQAYDFYKFPGATSKQSPNYQIKVLSQFNTKRIPGLPASQIGSLKLRIKHLLSNGSTDSVYVRDLNGQCHNLNKVEAIIFNNNTNITQRSPLNNILQATNLITSSESTSRCNLYLDGNPLK